MLERDELESLVNRIESAILTNDQPSKIAELLEYLQEGVGIEGCIKVLLMIHLAYEGDPNMDPVLEHFSPADRVFNSIEYATLKLNIPLVTLLRQYTCTTKKAYILASLHDSPELVESLSYSKRGEQLIFCLDDAASVIQYAGNSPKVLTWLYKNLENLIVPPLSDRDITQNPCKLITLAPNEIVVETLVNLLPHYPNISITSLECKASAIRFVVSQLYSHQEPDRVFKFFDDEVRHALQTPEHRFLLNDAINTAIFMSYKPENLQMLLEAGAHIDHKNCDLRIMHDCVSDYDLKTFMLVVNSVRSHTNEEEFLSFMTRQCIPLDNGNLWAPCLSYNDSSPILPVLLSLLCNELTNLIDAFCASGNRRIIEINPHHTSILKTISQYGHENIALEHLRYFIDKITYHQVSSLEDFAILATTSARALREIEPTKLYEYHNKLIVRSFGDEASIQRVMVYGAMTANNYVGEDHIGSLEATNIFSMAAKILHFILGPVYPPLSILPDSASLPKDMQDYLSNIISSSPPMIACKDLMGSTTAIESTIYSVTHTTRPLSLQGLCIRKLCSHDNDTLDTATKLLAEELPFYGYESDYL